MDNYNPYYTLYISNKDNKMNEHTLADKDRPSGRIFKCPCC